MMAFPTDRLLHKSVILSKFITFAQKAALVCVVYIVFCAFSFTESWASIEKLRRIASYVPVIGEFFSEGPTQRSAAVAARKASMPTGALPVSVTTAPSDQKSIQVFERSDSYDLFSIDSFLSSRQKELGEVSSSLRLSLSSHFNFDFDDSLSVARFSYGLSSQGGRAKKSRLQDPLFFRPLEDQPSDDQVSPEDLTEDDERSFYPRLQEAPQIVDKQVVVNSLPTNQSSNQTPPLVHVAPKAYSYLEASAIDIPIQKVPTPMGISLNSSAPGDSSFAGNGGEKSKASSGGTSSGPQSSGSSKPRTPSTAKAPKRPRSTAAGNSSSSASTGFNSPPATSASATLSSVIVPSATAATLTGPAVVSALSPSLQQVTAHRGPNPEVLVLQLEDPTASLENTATVALVPSSPQPAPLEAEQTDVPSFSVAETAMLPSPSAPSSNTLDGDSESADVVFAETRNALRPSLSGSAVVSALSPSLQQVTAHRGPNPEVSVLQLEDPTASLENTATVALVPSSPQPAPLEAEQTDVPSFSVAETAMLPSPSAPSSNTPDGDSDASDVVFAETVSGPGPSLSGPAVVLALSPSLQQVTAHRGPNPEVSVLQLEDPTASLENTATVALAPSSPQPVPLALEQVEVPPFTLARTVELPPSDELSSDVIDVAPASQDMALTEVIEEQVPVFGTPVVLTSLNPIPLQQAVRVNTQLVSLVDSVRLPSLAPVLQVTPRIEEGPVVLVEQRTAVLARSQTIKWAKKSRPPSFPMQMLSPSIPWLLTASSVPFFVRQGYFPRFDRATPKRSFPLDTQGTLVRKGPIVESQSLALVPSVRSSSYELLTLLSSVFQRFPSTFTAMSGFIPSATQVKKVLRTALSFQSALVENFALLPATPRVRGDSLLEPVNQASSQGFSIDNRLLVNLINFYKHVQGYLAQTTAYCRNEIVNLMDQQKKNRQEVKDLGLASEKQLSAFSASSKELIDQIRNATFRINTNQEERVKLARLVSTSFNSLVQQLGEISQTAQRHLTDAQQALVQAEQEEAGLMPAFLERDRVRRQEIGSLNQQIGVIMKPLDDLREEIESDLTDVRIRVYDFLKTCLTAGAKKAGQEITEELELQIADTVRTLLAELDAYSDDELADTLTELQAGSDLSLEDMTSGTIHIANFRTLAKRLADVDFPEEDRAEKWQEIARLRARVKTQKDAKENDISATEDAINEAERKCVTARQDVETAQKRLTTLTTLIQEFNQNFCREDEDTAFESITRVKELLASTHEVLGERNTEPLNRFRETSREFGEQLAELTANINRGKQLKTARQVKQNQLADLKSEDAEIIKCITQRYASAQETRERLDKLCSKNKLANKNVLAMSRRVIEDKRILEDANTTFLRDAGSLTLDDVQDLLRFIDRVRHKFTVGEWSFAAPYWHAFFGTQGPTGQRTTPDKFVDVEVDHMPTSQMMHLHQRFGLMREPEEREAPSVH